MMRKLLFLLVMFPVCCMAQSKYCVTWQDFLDGQWREPEGRVELVPSSKDDALAMVVKAEKKKPHISCVVEPVSWSMRTPSISTSVVSTPLAMSMCRHGG